MSRDYTLEFDDLNLMNSSLQTLNNLKLNDKKFFNVNLKRIKSFRINLFRRAKRK